MKNLRNYYAAFLLFALLFVAAAAPAQTDLQQKLGRISAITETRPLESTRFSEKYVTYFTQPLDHRRPEKGSFRQRVIVSHVGFDRPTVIVTEGYGAAYALNPKYREELSELLDANMILWNTVISWNPPLSLKTGNTSPPRIPQTTCTPSATPLKSIYPGKWIATGISKGGQTTLLYRTFYPDDVDISVPYVAPLCYGVEDGRHEPFLRKVSTPEDRKRIEDFQLEVLKRKAALLPRFEKYCDEKGLKFRAPVEEIYDYCVLEYSFALWQWGTPVSSIPATTASDDEIFAHLLGISNPDYFIADSPTASFFVQAARELGYYGYDTKPFKKYLSIQSSKGYLHHLMLPEELKDMPFDKTLSKKITKFLKENDPKMIFIYGENDPWTAAGVTWLKGKKNIHVFVEPGGSHRARIGTLPEEEKKQVMELINEWLKQ